MLYNPDVKQLQDPSLVEELREKVEEAERPSAGLCSRSLAAKEERKETEVKMETIVLSSKIEIFP